MQLILFYTKIVLLVCSLIGATITNDTLIHQFLLSVSIIFGLLILKQFNASKE